ncbi:MAG TPA: cytochrome c oxidase assembly protein [Candidatus Elarobacter sp.]|jgi:putative copper resistance protein D|nr:cytochrome c oxidase assembly protein [Candidatus Elarobacter sp.]
MIIAVGVLIAAGLYAWGLARVRAARRPFPIFAVVAFAAGLAVTAASLLGPLDELSDASLAWHMAQHLVLVSVAAPLLLLGAPHRLALAAMPPRGAAVLARVLNSAPLRVLTHPAVAWLQFSVVLYGTHFSPLYEAALENEAIHACEHVLYLTSALIFWTPVLAVAPAPHAPPHPIRILMLFLALPMSAFLGFAFYVNRTVLYAHYAARPDALADQTNAGVVMWTAGGAPLFLAILWCIADWGARERRLDAISDALSP